MRREILQTALPLLTALFACLPSVAAAAFVLVEEGVSRVPIVLDAEAPPRTREAAAELADSVYKISGVRPEVIEGVPEPLPESAVWVGYQPAVAALFPDVDLNFAPPEEIVIAATGRHLLIAGYDQWDPEHMTVIGRRDAVVEGFQQAYGTANAVYTFIQDYLDVRWLWPGELGEDVIRRGTLSFAPFEYRFQPQMRLRSGMFRFSAVGDNRGNAHEWTRRQRLKLDSSGSGHELLRVIGGHAFGDWWERFHETHPEYFALQPDGARSGFPGPRAAKLCKSNPAVWEQWLEDVDQIIAENPNRLIFNAAANDSHNRGLCICENCRAWDHPEGEPWRLSWPGITQQYVGMSDRYVTFANQLGRKLRERHPDRDYYVLIFAYGPSLAAAVDAVPDDNVIVAGVHSFLLEYDLERRPQFGDWGRVAPNLMWRPNTPVPPGFRDGFPINLVNQVKRSIRYAGEQGCMGVFVDGQHETSWARQGPMSYLMGRLAWDPLADSDMILDDYYRRGFGPAADAVRAFWNFIEAKSEHILNTYPRFWLERQGGDFGEVYDDEAFARAEALLDAADRAAADAPAVYQARIAMLRAGMQATRLQIDQIRLLRQLRASETADPEALTRARANWEALWEIGRAYPNLVFRSAGYRPVGEPSNQFRPPE